MDALPFEERPPTPEEARTIESRTERKRGAHQRHAVGGGDPLFVGALGLALAIGVHFFMDGFGRWMLTVFGAALASIGVFGWWRARTRKAERIAAIDAEGTGKLESVRELRFSTVGVRAVSDPHGDGETYWVCEREGRDFVVLASYLWDPAEKPPDRWCSEVTVVLDASSVIVNLGFEGEPVPVDRRDVRPPDFEVTDEHLFWEPPPEVERLPAVVTELDPRPLGEHED